MTPEGGFTFQPEEVRAPTAWEKIQLGKERAYKTFEHLQQASGGFDYRRFMTEFVPALMASYNKSAKALGLPPAKKEWFAVTRAMAGSASAPKEFYTKFRNRLQPRIFPGDIQKAKKAYDLLLDEMSKLPTVVGGPVSGVLSHEMGHVKTYYGDPSVAVKSEKPEPGYGGERPVLEIVVDEAVASYNGFRAAWNAWKKFGIPRKAWGAWAGFPSYIGRLSRAQVVQLFIHLKKIEDKYPGINFQARKALLDYDRYIEPTLYNIPGADWTPAEKKALQRFLKVRGGTYRGTMPATPEERLQHMKQQPYVMKTPTSETRRASEYFPLSVRADVIKFPGERMERPEGPPELGEVASSGPTKEPGEVASSGSTKEPETDIISPGFTKEPGKFMIFIKGWPVGWFDREHKANQAAEVMIRNFVDGRKSLIGDSVEMDAPVDDLAEWMERTGKDISGPIKEFLESLKYQEARAKVAPMMVNIVSIENDTESGTEGIPSGSLYELEERFSKVSSEAVDELDWDSIAKVTDVTNDIIRRIGENL
jgi:hypothetical protein